MRGTGGNRFIAADSDRTMLAAAIQRGLEELDQWARDAGRVFDAGAITVETKRTASGAISVSVTGDLIDPGEAEWLCLHCGDSHETHEGDCCCHGWYPMPPEGGYTAEDC